jgi:hypothetical protein
MIMLLKALKAETEVKTEAETKAETEAETKADASLKKENSNIV